ncbi:FixH family protein [Peribacillus kribbensis]|uniref:FixH family protein n=1 Tax=Peribacillus kribbensis TaxID=356658 RepID=UPI00041E1A4A|nr:FixH family protein [Peribacillus kribbensis]
MQKYGAAILTALLLLSGCSDSGHRETRDAVPKMLDVQLHIPKTAEVNQEVELSAKVTQDKKAVTDAEKVEFEIRRNGEAESEMVEVKTQKKGIYKIKKTFSEDGVYLITSHVTARDMHSMPSGKLIVGKGDTAAAKESDNGGGEHDHSGDVQIHLMGVENIKAHADVLLTAHVSNHNEPLEKAAVRFELWKDGESRHEYLDAKEAARGVYTYTHKFPAAGFYHVKVHVEKEEKIHEHIEMKVVVK